VDAKYIQPYLAYRPGDPDTIDFSAFRYYVPLSIITVEGRKHLLGTLTFGDNFDLYGGNEAASLTFGASFRHYPYGQLLFVGTEAIENYQSKESPDIWWEDYKVSDGAGGWEDYRVKE
jgi:hypothetical protein